MTSELAISADLPTSVILLATAVSLVGLALLALEVVRARVHRGRALLVALSGVLAVLALYGAIVRPTRVDIDGTRVGPLVAVVADGSRSMDLPLGGATRAEAQARAVRDLEKRKNEARFSYFSFGRGSARPWSDDERSRPDGRARAVPDTESDLSAALESIVARGDEPPSAIVVFSDGRLDRPTEAHALERSSLGMGTVGIPVHTVAVAREPLRDASVRQVRSAGATVAHQELPLRVEVGCSGGLACERMDLVVRELRDRGEPEVLAKSEVTVDASGTALVEVPVILHRAGARVLEVALETPSGDELPDNDRRLVTLDVARDRIRVLHVAGRPTYDVRALRNWLKSDQSIDVVAFFILRTPGDDVGALPDELALIPFPVDEHFSVHLPSFDAVVLQDFNAEVYGLSRHLDNLARYVDGGGGVIMVGGPDAFGPGKYARSVIAEALPVVLDASHEDRGVDAAWFQPSWTRAGRSAPVLGPLRDAIGDALPEMPGTNLVGPARPGATVLLTHPTRKVSGPNGDENMPVLALGEYGTGRTIALTFDGSHQLSMSKFAVGQAGRAHAALWDALVGWLMRDPRYESTAIDRPKDCIAGEPSTLTLRPLAGAEGRASVEIVRLGTGDSAHRADIELRAGSEPIAIDLPPLASGGYSATVRIGGDDGAKSRSLAPATRVDFACERGGSEWADSRPDPERLAAIARATGGIATTADELGAIPWPEPTLVRSSRTTSPLAPTWAWAFLAALLVGAHWAVRRRSGLA